MNEQGEIVLFYWVVKIFMVYVSTKVTVTGVEMKENLSYCKCVCYKACCWNVQATFNDRFFIRS